MPQKRAALLRCRSVALAPDQGAAGVGDGELWELLCTLHFVRCHTSGVAYGELVGMWHYQRPLCSLHEYVERLFEQGLLQHPALSAEEAVKEFDRVREIVVGSDLPNDITRKWR